jgi:hypothetical protein
MYDRCHFTDNGVNQKLRRKSCFRTMYVVRGNESGSNKSVNAAMSKPISVEPSYVPVLPERMYSMYLTLLSMSAFCIYFLR